MRRWLPRRLRCAPVWGLALLAPAAPLAGAGACLDPTLETRVAAPEGVLRAAGSTWKWPAATLLAGPETRTVQGSTGVGGQFEARADLFPPGSFGFRLQVAFDLTGTQGLAVSGARSRLELPLELDLPALPAGLPLVADVSLSHSEATIMDSGTVSSTAVVEALGPAPATATAGPLTTVGSTGLTLSGQTRQGGPEFKVTLDADAFVMARGGTVALTGVLTVIIRSSGDFDGDGLPDLVELDGPDGVPATGDEGDPGRVDADGDGELDSAEIARGGDAFSACDVNLAAATTRCLRLAGDMVSWWPLSTCAGPPAYHLYRGRLDVLLGGGDYTQKVNGAGATGGRFCGLGGTSQADAAAPQPGQPLSWLVSGEVGGVEVSLGTTSAGAVRPNANSCP